MLKEYIQYFSTSLQITYPGRAVQRRSWALHLSTQARIHCPGLLQVHPRRRSSASCRKMQNLTRGRADTKVGPLSAQRDRCSVRLFTVESARRNVDYGCDLSVTMCDGSDAASRHHSRVFGPSDPLPRGPSARPKLALSGLGQRVPSAQFSASWKPPGGSKSQVGVCPGAEGKGPTLWEPKLALAVGAEAPLCGPLCSSPRSGTPHGAIRWLAG